MKKLLQIISILMASVGLFVLPSVAQAQDLTLRLEPGVAIPLGAPQANRFDVGGAFAVKPELSLGSYFSVGPSLSFISLPSDVSGVDTGTAAGYGLFGRVKRPHDEKNTDRGFAAVSPWFDLDAQYVRTGPLDRFGWAVAAGAAVPTSDSRQLWVGPFVRYQSVYQANGHPGFDTTDAKVLVAGLSFEFGPGVKKDCPPAPQQVVTQPEPPQPQLVTEKQTVHRKVVVQFAWDSAVLNQQARDSLDAIVNELALSNDFGAIHVEGHASSEGQVEHNNVLAKKRAVSVANYLLEVGVPAEVLSVEGFGSRVPVATNSTEAGRVLNRRAQFDVDFTITVYKNAK